MYVDSEQAFSTAQALTGTAASTNYIDLGSDRNIGKGEPLAVVIDVGVAADTTTGDETYQFDVETDDNTGFSSARILSRRAYTNAQAVAELKPAGARVVMPLGHDNERYLRLNYTLAGTTPTITVSARLMPMSMVQADDLYPDGITITG